MRRPEPEDLNRRLTALARGCARGYLDTDPVGLVRRFDDPADREIAAANGKPEWESDIRSTFAQRWVAKARGGWWYRDAAGGWKQK